MTRSHQEAKAKGGVSSDVFSARDTKIWICTVTQSTCVPAR